MHNTIVMHKNVERILRCLIKIAEEASEGIAIATLDGIIRFVNKSWAEIHGYSNPQELTGKKIDIFHTQEKMTEDVIPCMEETKHRGQLAGMIEHIRKDGSPFLTDMKMMLVADDNGKAIAIIIFAADITEHKQAEDRLIKRCKLIEQRAEELVIQLAAARKQLQNEITQRKKAEENLLESIIEADEPPGPIRPPFNPQELKALSELAKRLA